MKPVGQLLEEACSDGAIASVYLRSLDGGPIGLLPFSSAEALLKHVTAIPLLTVTGDLPNGFAWSVPGAHPRRSYTVVPLAAPAWPHMPRPTMITVELWWPADQYGRRRVRSFVAWADSPYNAYLIACCLWSSASTGAGAEAAFLYGPDRRVAHRINAAAWTCAHLPAATVARAAASTADRFSTEPLPDARKSAMHEERIEGIWTYTGTREEITTCLREHADGREASMDAPGAYAMRQAATEIGSGLGTEFRSKTQAHYRVLEAADDVEGGVA